MESDSDILLFALACLAAVACCWGFRSPQPGFEAPYSIQQRREAHWNLPRWARGDYPQPNEPRQPNRFLGLEW